MKPRILIIVNDETTIYNFRREILKAFYDQGYDVTLCIPKGNHTKEIKECGCKVVNIEVNRHGKNPLQDIKILKTCIQMIDKYKPNLVLTYTVKPNIYGSSLAISLKKVTEDNLFSALSKSFNRVLEKGEYTTPAITIHNMGVTNETLRHILVRAGVNSLELGDYTQIPATTDPVTVRLMDEEAWNSDVKEDQIRFARQKDVSFGQVWINDIEGSLVATDDWFDSTHPRYAFVRDEDGNKTSAGSGTEVEIESATMYIGEVPVFFFENETGRSTEGFISDVQDLVDRYANTEDDDEEDEENSYDLPFVVIFTTNEGSEMDKAMGRAFGNRYIRNDGYASEMTDRKYKKLSQQVYENLDSQGCFDSVKEKIALAIQEAEGL